MADSPSIPPIQGDNNVISVNQQGGQIAHTINNYNSTVNIGAKPEIGLSPWEHEVISQGHRYRAILTVRTEYAVPRLRVVVHAPSILAFAVQPRASGLHFTGHSGQRGNYHFTTLQNPAGEYRLEVVTANPETIVCDISPV